MRMSNCSDNLINSNQNKVIGKGSMQVDSWIKGMGGGKKFDNPRPYAGSYNAGMTSSSNKNKKMGNEEVISMVFNKPKVFDKSRKSNMQWNSGNPPEKNLFSNIEGDFVTPQKSNDNFQRKSFNTHDGGNEDYQNKRRGGGGGGRGGGGGGRGRGGGGNSGTGGGFRPRTNNTNSSNQDKRNYNNKEDDK